MRIQSYRQPLLLRSRIIVIKALFIYKLLVTTIAVCVPEIQLEGVGDPCKSVFLTIEHPYLKASLFSLEYTLCHMDQIWSAAFVA